MSSDQTTDQSTPEDAPYTAWLDVMRRVRDARRCLIFSRRNRFDDELRPFTGHGAARIAYPDAIYHVTTDDFERAWQAVQ